MIIRPSYQPHQPRDTTEQAPSPANRRPALPTQTHPSTIHHEAPEPSSMQPQRRPADMHHKKTRPYHTSPTHPVQCAQRPLHNILMPGACEHCHTLSDQFDFRDFFFYIRRLPTTSTPRGTQLQPCTLTHHLCIFIFMGAVILMQNGFHSSLLSYLEDGDTMMYAIYQ